VQIQQLHRTLPVVLVLSDVEFEGKNEVNGHRLEVQDIGG